MNFFFSLNDKRILIRKYFKQKNKSNSNQLQLSPPPSLNSKNSNKVAQLMGMEVSLTEEQINGM